MKFFPSRTEDSQNLWFIRKTAEDYKGLIKVGYTTRDVLVRMREHYPTAGPDGIERFKVLFEESMRDDGTYFHDHVWVHAILESGGIERSGFK